MKRLEKVVKSYVDDLIESEMHRRFKQVRKQLTRDRKATQRLITKALPSPDVVDAEFEERD